MPFSKCGQANRTMETCNLTKIQSPGHTDPDVVSGYERQVQSAYDGEVVIANDLDRF